MHMKYQVMCTSTHENRYFIKRDQLFINFSVKINLLLISLS